MVVTRQRWWPDNGGDPGPVSFSRRKKSVMKVWINNLTMGISQNKPNDTLESPQTHTSIHTLTNKTKKTCDHSDQVTPKYGSFHINFLNLQDALQSHFPHKLDFVFSFTSTSTAAPFGAISIFFSSTTSGLGAWASCWSFTYRWTHGKNVYMHKFIVNQLMTI